MAEISLLSGTPVNGVAVDLATNQKNIATVLTDSSGNYSYNLKIKESEYNNITFFKSVFSKPGYNSGGIQVDKPTLQDAILNGINMSGLISKLGGGSTTFNLDRYSLRVPYESSSNNIVVTAPNDSWYIEESYSWINVSKIPGGAIVNVSANPDQTERSAQILFGSGEQTLVLSITQDSYSAPPITNGVILKGKVTQYPSMSAVAGSEVWVDIYSDYSRMFYDYVKTDSLGNYQITAALTKEIYDNITSISFYTIKEGYQSSTTRYQFVPPTYESATSIGITQDIVINPTEHVPELVVYPQEITFSPEGQSIGYSSVTVEKPVGSTLTINVDPGRRISYVIRRLDDRTDIIDFSITSTTSTSPWSYMCGISAAGIQQKYVTVIQRPATAQEFMVSSTQLFFDAYNINMTTGEITTPDSKVVTVFGAESNGWTYSSSRPDVTVVKNGNSLTISVEVRLSTATVNNMAYINVTRTSDNKTFSIQLSQYGRRVSAASDSFVIMGASSPVKYYGFSADNTPNISAIPGSLTIRGNTYSKSGVTQLIFGDSYNKIRCPKDYVSNYTNLTLLNMSGHFSNPATSATKLGDNAIGSIINNCRKLSTIEFGKIQNSNLQVNPATTVNEFNNCYRWDGTGTNVKGVIRADSITYAGNIVNLFPETRAYWMAYRSLS
jgi:hypothetical protein